MEKWTKDTIVEAKNKLDLYYRGGEWKKEEIMITQAAGRYLAENIVCDENIDDIKEGEILFKTGHIVGAKDIAVLAAAGKAIVNVFKKPIVSILSVGEELVSVIDRPEPGQRRDGNSFVLACLAEKTGSEKGQVFLVKEMDKIKEYLNYAMNRSDLVLIAGGSSLEDKNLIAEAIDSIGAPGVSSCGIFMEPGANTVIGMVKDGQCHCENRMSALAFAFPGDPASIMITYKVFADYFLKKYYFQAEQKEIIVPAVVEADICPATNAGEDIINFVLVKLNMLENGDFSVIPVSNGLAGIRDADGYVEIKAGVEVLKKGTSVQVKMFD